MKTLKKNIFPALTCLILSFALLATASMAWLSINKETSSAGMQMEIETSPNLIISTSSTDIADMTEDDWSETGDTNYIKVTWSDTAKELAPATHDTSSGTGLIYNTNPTAVSRTTGLKKSDTDLTFDNVPTYTSGTRYYIDYVVYIASLTDALSCTDLKLTIAETSSLTGTNNAYKAASADVYMALASAGSDDAPVAVGTDTYVGTLNLTGTAANTSVTAAYTTVPLNTSDSIAVLFRCYFDGAAGADSTSTYVNSVNVSTAEDAVQFSITITAE